jgi:hypothetical protein
MLLHLERARLGAGGRRIAAIVGAALMAGVRARDLRTLARDAVAFA